MTIFWRMFKLLNLLALMLFLLVMVWAAFDLHRRVQFVYLAQIPPVVMIAIRHILKNEVKQ